MIRFKALTGDDSDDESQSEPAIKASTKEAQEGEAFSLYNQALLLVKEGQTEQAADAFIELLNYTLLQEAAPLTSNDEGLVHPGLVLKYSAYKNLAKLSQQCGDHTIALDYYLDAVCVDNTDVTVWYNIGQLAVKLDNISLARHAFEQGLECNSKHWPCLENLIPILYALNNYQGCLTYIARALEMDDGFLVGKAFMHKIFSEQPSLRRQTFEMFSECCQSVYEPDSDTELSEECVEEALSLRRKKQELSKVPPIPSIKPSHTTNIKTWKQLGETLLGLYDRIQTEIRHHMQYESEKQKPSFSQMVDLSAPESADPREVAPPVATDPDPVPMIITTDTTQSNSQEHEPMDMQGTDGEVVPSSGEVVPPSGEVLPSTGDFLEPGEVSAGITPATSQSSLLSSQSTGSKRGRKRKFGPMGEDYLGKRRSARVRNTTKKKKVPTATLR